MMCMQRKDAIGVDGQLCEEKQINKKEIEFAVFCIENLANALGRNGKEMYELLTVKSDIIEDYIIENYAVLHTQGKEYIVEDIIRYMEDVGVL